MYRRERNTRGGSRDGDAEMPVLQEKTVHEATGRVPKTHPLAAEHGECGRCRGTDAGRDRVSAVGTY